MQKLQLLLLPLGSHAQSQDACALCRHCEPCKQSSWSRARNSQENRPFLTASGVGIQVSPGPLLFHERRPWICIPVNARYPITAGASGRQMENLMKNCLSWSLNSGTLGPEPMTQPLYHTHTHNGHVYHARWLMRSIDSQYPLRWTYISIS